MKDLLARSDNPHVSQSVEVLDSVRSSILSLLSGNVSIGNRHAPQSGKIVGFLKQLKDGMSTDLSDLEKEISVLTKELTQFQLSRTEAQAGAATAVALVTKARAAFENQSSDLLADIDVLSKAIAALEKGRAVMNAKKVSDSYRTSVWSFSPGGSSEGGRYTPQSSEIVGILKQMKDEISAGLLAFEEEELGRKNNHQNLVKAKTQEISGLTKTDEEKTMLQETLSVKIEKMKSELFVAARTLFADKEMASKLTENCSTQASEWEERQRLRAEELVDIHDTIKLMNDDDSLELFKETLPSSTLMQLRDNKRGVARERVLCSADHQVHHASI